MFNTICMNLVVYCMYVWSPFPYDIQLCLTQARSYYLSTQYVGIYISYRYDMYNGGT